MTKATAATISISILSGALLAIPAIPVRSAEDASPPGETIESARGEASAPIGTLAEVLAIPDPYRRADALARLLPTLGPEAVPEVREAMDRALLGMGVTELELLVRMWASHDPRAAATWAFGITAPRFQAAALDASIEVWARSDPAAAAAGVVRATEDPVLRELAQTVQGALTRGWFQQDRAGLEHYMEGLGSGIQQQRSLMAFALTLERAEGAEAVARWAEALPDQNERYKLAAFRQVGAALAWTSPKIAEQWCDVHCEGPYGKSLRSAIVRMRLGNGDDGQEVVEWVTRTPDGPSRDHALATAFQMWARADRETALSWMEEKMEGEPAPWVPVLYPAYARHLAASSPPDALKVAALVERDAQREELMVRIAHRWLAEDEAAALAWLEQSPLPPAARAKARNPKLPDYLPEPVSP
jgi:hypothetical protein